MKHSPWQELAGDDVLETSENLLPEFIAAQQSKKETFESTAEWFQANNKRRQGHVRSTLLRQHVSGSQHLITPACRRDYEENFAPVGPSWAAVQANRLYLRLLLRIQNAALTKT